MICRDITVQMTDVGLAEVAISLGAGTITRTRPTADGNVVITYIAPRASIALATSVAAEPGGRDTEPSADRAREARLLAKPYANRNLREGQIGGRDQVQGLLTAHSIDEVFEPHALTRQQSLE